MKKILHLIHTPRHSGAEALVRDLCLLHSAQGAKCAIAAVGPMKTEFEADSQRLAASGTELYFPSYNLGKMGRIGYFRKAIASFGPDAIYAHSVLPSLYGRLAVPLFGDRPKFMTVLHSASNDDFAGTYLTAAEHLLRWRADQVIAVSKLGAQNYIRRFGASVPVEVVPNGIDIAKFREADRDMARARFGVAPGKRIVLQVGRLSEVKQQDLSIRALSGYLKSHDAELWLAGLTEDPQYETMLRALVVEEGLKGKVKFLGSRSDVPELLAAADLYLMPSKAEAHSIAVLEALASGIPIVLSDIPAFDDFRGMEGVEFLPRNDVELSLSKSVGQLAFLRHSRSMDSYALSRTAERYLRGVEKAMLQ